MRGHAKGPFDQQSNIRVQNVQVIAPNTTITLNVTASPADPVLLRFLPWVTEAFNTGTNTLKVGTASNDDAYYEVADTDLETTGAKTEKKFLVTETGQIIIAAASTAIAASKALTISAITAADTQTVTIGGQVYTFNTSLTNTANNVLIGVDATAMGANLAAAINAGAGAGTTYGTGTVANASVTASAALGVVTVTARTAGTAGNSVAISETLTNSAWAGGATTLSGGENVATTGSLTFITEA